MQYQYTWPWEVVKYTGHSLNFTHITAIPAVLGGGGGGRVQGHHKIPSLILSYSHFLGTRVLHI